MQFENKEQLKALKKMDGQQLEKDENAVLMEGIATKAKDKRKRLDDDNSIEIRTSMIFFKHSRSIMAGLPISCYIRQTWKNTITKCTKQTQIS